MHGQFGAFDHGRGNPPQRRRSALSLFSAGSIPKGLVNPYALKVLDSFGYPTDDLLSKSWEVYTAPNAPDALLVARLLAEGLGTAFLLATVVGSGVMGAKLAGGNTALVLLGNALPTVPFSSS